MLAIAAAIPPLVGNGLDFLLSVTPAEIKQYIPQEIQQFGGTTFAYQAFPQEVNNVAVNGNALNFFLLLEEGGDNVPILRLGPAITDELIEEIRVGVIDIVADVEFPISALFGFDLPDSAAIVPNPQAILQFFPFFDEIASGINSLLDFGIPDITFPEVRFPKLEIPDLGVVCPCEIIPEFRLIPEFTLFPGFTLSDALPKGLVDVLRGIASFVEDVAPGGIYIHTLDGDDTIDTSHLTGIQQALFGGVGNDIIMPGGGEQLIEALGLPGIPGLQQPSINVFGDAGRDTIVVNRRFDVDDLNVDGGSGNDVLLIDGSDGNDIFELFFDPQGVLTQVRFLAPNPSAGAATNTTQRLTLPANTLGGTFSLTLDRSSVVATTVELPYDASAEVIEDELEKLPNIGVGNVRVTGPAAGPWTIEFVGNLAAQSVPRLTPDGANLVRRDGNLTVVRTHEGDATRGTNEMQRITLPTEADGTRFITGGTFTLTYTGAGVPEQTAPIRHNALPSEIQQALEELTSIEPGDVRVVGLSGGPWMVEFQGNLALTPQPELIGDGSNLTGGVNPTLTQLNGAARVQTIALPAPRGTNSSLGGTFALSYDNGSVSDTTVPLAWNASSAAIQAALENLASIGGGNATVSGPAGGPWSVALRGKAGLAGAPLITAHADSLTGGASLNIEESVKGSGVNEVQRISAPLANGGTFRLTFNNGAIARTTGDIPFDATVSEIQAALQQLTSLGGPDNVVVTGTNGGPWDVEFTGDLAAAEQLELLVVDSGLQFSTVPPAVVELNPGGGGTNEVQQLSAPVATGGTFTLSFSDGIVSAQTSPIPFHATADQLRDALQALPNIGSGNISVVGTAGGPWEVEFTGGGLEDSDLPLMTVDGSGLTGLPVVTELTSHVAGENETQSIAFAPQANGGQFTLTFDGEPTVSLPHDATAAQVQAALENLASLNVGEVLVSSVNPTGGPWTVEFAGRLAATDVPLITGDATNLAGGFSNTEILIAADATQPGVNERQTITMPAAPANPEAGTFQLRFSGNSTLTTTADIPYNATAQEVEDALEALSNIGPGNVIVTSPNPQGGPWTVEFTQQLAATDFALMAVNASQLSRNDPIESLEVQAAQLTNELQTITLPAMTSGGTFTLAFNDGNVQETTQPIPFDASPADVRAALEALSTIQPGDVVVRGGVGDPSVGETVSGGVGIHEIQTVTLSPLALGGTFNLTFDNGSVTATTAPLAFDSDAQAVQDALEALSNIGAGNVQVTGAQGGPFAIQFTGALGGTNQPMLVADGTNLTQLQHSPWEVEFTGQYAAQAQQTLVADGSLLELTGINPTVAQLTQGSDGAPLVLKTTTFSQLVSVEQLQVNGNGGDDRLVVRGAPAFPLDMIFDGGAGIDYLQLVSTAGTPSFVSPIFPDSTQGVLTMDGQQIQIADVEGGIELNAGDRAGSVLFSGTDEANDMRFAGVSSSVATIARDGQVTTTLTGFASGSTLTIRGEQGDDVISVAPHEFQAFENVSIFGGGPSGADAVRFEGTSGDDVFAQTPSATSVKAGTMVINGITAVYDGIEEVDIQGLAGIDSLTVLEPALGSNDNILFNPEVANDGSFQFTAQPSSAQTALAYYPVRFGSIESRIFNTGEGSDVITASTNNLPGVNSSVLAIGGNGTTTLYFGDQPTVFQHVTDGSDVLSLEIGTTVDLVTVEPGTGVVIAVNTSVGDDTLVYRAPDDNPVLVDLATSRIESPGLDDVTFTSAEIIVVEGGGANALSVQGLASENRFAYTPRGRESGRVTLADVPSAVEFLGIGGTFTLLGGPAVSDEVLVVGSNAPDGFTVDLAARTVQTVNAVSTELAMLSLDASIESVAINGGPGDDLARVLVADDLVAAPHVQFNGGTPDASDRLIFVDEGVGNLVLHREGPVQRSGTIRIDDGPPVSYETVERIDVLPVDPVTGGTGADGLGQIVVLDTDIFEQNDNRRVPTPFEDLAEATTRPNIDPPTQFDPFGVQLPGDEDWYRYPASRTGTLRFLLQFEPVGPLANGQAGLPGDGQLRIDVYTADGTLIDRLPGEGPEQHTVGVESGQTYLLRIRGATPDAVNAYELTVVDDDEVGPRITDVFVTGVPDYDLFDPKPVTGPTPPVYSLTIRVEDPVARRPGFLYEALNEQIASNPGHYRLVGDHTGPIAIESVTVLNDPRVAGELATASILLGFAKPLPDDRFTLTVFDNLIDPVGNVLDGESTAATPQSVAFPTGDGVPGGDFLARFTVDSRPEIGVTASTRIYVDINGNFQFDPAGSGDITNRDLIFQMGSVSSAYFAGDFSAATATSSSGFDKLGAFDWDPFARKYRFLLDFNHNGVPDFVSYANVPGNGLPVAGEFDPAHPGDEIGLFVGNAWYLDTNGDNTLDANSDQVISTTMRGIPIVGDVNGDGSDDLLTYDAGADRFQIDLNRDGLADDTIAFGIPDFVERPVIGDLNLDGVDDLGLWVAGNPEKIGEGKAEWYFLLSDRVPAQQASTTQLASALFDPFSPDPLGNDLFANFGDRASLPVFGNFDPPVTGNSGTTVSAGQPLMYTNTTRPLDVNNDGSISPLDALIVISQLNTSGGMTIPDVRVEYAVSGPFVDVNADRMISPLDALIVINHLNRPTAAEGEAGSTEPGVQAAQPAPPTSALAQTLPPPAVDQVLTPAGDDGDRPQTTLSSNGSTSEPTFAAELWIGTPDKASGITDSLFDRSSDEDDDFEELLSLLVGQDV